MSKLQKIIAKSFLKHNDKKFVSLKKNFAFERYTYGEIYDKALRFSQLLNTLNIKRGDRIVICSYNSPQYVVAYLGCLFSGVILVPLDFASSENFILKIIKTTNSKLLITSNLKIIGNLGLKLIKTNDLKNIKNINASKINVENLFEILKKLKKKKINNNIKDKNLVQILYTSGTTGNPKGVMLTHNNLYENITAISKVIKLTHKDKSLSVLPLSHVFEQVCGFLYFQINGASITYMKSRRGSEIINLFQKEKINLMLTVPALLIIFKNKIEEKAKTSGNHKSLLKALKLADKLPIYLRRLLFKRIHQSFGGKLKKIVVGGASLPIDVELFWERIGIKIIKGYGLTETSPIVTATPENNRLLGSVGPTIPGVKLKFSKQQEILVKGKNVFCGYYQKNINLKNISLNNFGYYENKLTKSEFDQDWFKTGDIGFFDKNNFLFIKGRLKNMILSESGLNVYPEDIEDKLNKIADIKESIVTGITKNNKVKIVAVLLLTKENRQKYQHQRKKLKFLINQVNQQLENHQKIADFIIWEEDDFPRTLTLKIKRKEIQQQLNNRDQVNTIEHQDKLINILSSLTHIKAEKIVDEMFLHADLGFDSLKILELATLVEEVLKVEIEESEINKKTTVKELRTMITNQKLKHKKNYLPQSMFWRIFVPFKLLLLKLGYLLVNIFITELDIKGISNLNNIKKKEQVIIISNHTSHFDIFIIMKLLPRHIQKQIASGGAADYFFKTNNFKSKIISWFMYHLFSSYPIPRDKKVKQFSLKESMNFVGEIIDKGWSLFLFPEGTRTMSGKINPFLNGIGLIVAETGLPVIPVKIEGLYQIFPKGTHFPKQKGNVKIKFGKKIQFNSDQSVENITQKLEKIIKAM